ncbi:MAG: MerR family transcriptional regulator, partial [Actinomycetota bacterium]
PRKTKIGNFIEKYSIDEISELTGFSRRTIRFYIEESIIKPPAGRGRGGFYYDSHLSDLMKIKNMQDSGLNLNSIREILKSESGNAQILKEQEEVFENYKRDTWVRCEIAEGLELHFKRSIEEKSGRKINEIIKIAKNIAKEI